LSEGLVSLASEAGKRPVDPDRRTWRCFLAPHPGALFAPAETRATSLFQIRAFGVPGMKHQPHFGSANVNTLTEVARIVALVGDLNRYAQLLDYDITNEEERVQVFDPSDATYPVLARTLAARRDNLRATVAALEKRLASLQEPAASVPA
jgi:hypothetical protein